MKRLFFPLILLLMTISACSLEAHVPSQAVDSLAAVAPIATENAAVQPMPETPVATQKPKAKKSTAQPANTTTPKTQNPRKSQNPEMTPSSTEFIAGEILGRSTATSITVNVVPAVAMEISYEFGAAPGQYTRQTASQAAAAGEPLETLIDGLKPNTRYYYRIRYGSSVGQEWSFVTQRAPGSTFTFDLQGDSHPERVGKEFNADLYTRTLQSAAADQPDFYLTMGDDFSVDQLQTVNGDTVKALYIQQRQWLGQVGAPVFLVNGNHEQASLANLNGTAEDVAVWAQTARNAYFPQPAPDGFYSGDTQSVPSIGPLRDYYAFTWGDALFVVIDFYWHSPTTVDNPFGAGHAQKPDRDLWDVTLGDAQYQWFRTTLEASNAKYKFVFAHHVLGTGRGGVELAGGYEWGDAAGLAAHRPGWDKTIQQLMADNHVTIFFQGHDHIFAHQALDGVVYQTLPEPADPNYSLFNAAAYHSGDLLPNSGHVRVSVSPDGVTVDYIRSSLDQPDETAFSYTVQ
jgi:phosphodiesterase/alkaline phosphatase D-like protein